MFARIKTNYETQSNAIYNTRVIAAVGYVIEHFIAGTTPDIGIGNRVFTKNGTDSGSSVVESVSGNPITPDSYRIGYATSNSSIGQLVVYKKHSQMANAYTGISLYGYTYGNENYGWGCNTGLASNWTATSNFLHDSNSETTYTTWGGTGPFAGSRFPEYIDIHMTDTSFAIWGIESGLNDRSVFFCQTDLEYIPAIDDHAKTQNTYYCPTINFWSRTGINASLVNLDSTQNNYRYYAPQQWSYELDGFVNADSSYGTNTSVGSNNLYTVDPILPFPTYGHAPLPTGDGYFEHMLIPMMYGGGEQTEIPRRMLGVARTSNDTFYHGETILNGAEKWIAAPNVNKTLYPTPFETLYGTEANYKSHGAWAFKQQPTV